MTAMFQLLEFLFAESHVQELFPNVLIDRLGFNLLSAVFQEPTLRNDVFGLELFGSRKVAGGHIHFGFGHQVFLDQFIQSHAFHGRERLIFFNPIP